MFSFLKFSKEDQRLLLGFEVKPAHSIVFLVLMFLHQAYIPTPEISLGWVAAAILAAVAVADLTVRAINRGKELRSAEKAATDVGKISEEEKTLKTEAAEMVTGVDPGKIESGIVRGMKPIQAAVQDQQMQVQQDLMASGGGAGVPGAAFDARAAALQRQIGEVGTEAISDLAVQETTLAQDDAQKREEQRLALIAASADLARTRAGQEASAALAPLGTGQQSQLGETIVAGASKSAFDKAFA